MEINWKDGTTTKEVDGEIVTTDSTTIYKESAINALKALTHWMETSTFDYEEDDLREILSEVLHDYKMYLQKPTE